MFYSQFILAKKGPLGTIWVAAHLERKLRKNQVADTDIGVSVDSILFPDIPIALRLSSHLLLGVVRIYSRKVNYLFDDCSEALLKIKQAFRSTAVDLPPEESTAPYHSITLPETFDLDDFELPEDDIIQGNYVDHHVSTREQITLQDNMDGVVYSTSQFGLDERFGDGDTSQFGLDLDEELLEKAASSKVGEVLLDSFIDPKATVETLSLHRGHDSDAETSEASKAISTHSFNIQAPSTPGLLEEPNLTTQEAQVSDDHMDECHNPTDLAAKEVSGAACSEPEVCHVDNDTVLPSAENQFLLDDQEVEKATSQADPTLEVDLMEPVVSSYSQSSSVSCGPDKLENSQNGIPIESQPSLASAFQSRAELGDVQEVGKDGNTALLSHVHEAASGFELPGSDPCTENFSDNSQANGFCSLASNCISENDKTSLEPGALKTVEGGSSLQVNSSNSAITDSEACRKLEQTGILCPDAHGKPFSPSIPVLQAHSSHLDDANAGLDSSVSGPKLPAEKMGLPSSRVSASEDTTETSGASTVVQEVIKPTLKAYQTLDPASCVVTAADKSTSDGQTDSIRPRDTRLEEENGAASSDLPSREKFLSLSDAPAGQPNYLLVDSTPAKEVIAEGNGDSVVNQISGTKRSFTESTLTLQSINSSESFGATQCKKSAEFMPNDDDLLSSILVGRRSTVLKVKPTPVPNTVSAKRRRVAPRPSPFKRKVLVDDMMVLHGDTIRQQLVNTEDIRRIRKKAPCTLPEIWMLQKNFLEDEIFTEPVFTGMSTELISLHCQPFDMSRTRVLQDEGSIAHSMAANEIETCMRPGFVEESGVDGNDVPSVARDDVDRLCVEAFDETPNQQILKPSSGLDDNFAEKDTTTIDGEPGPGLGTSGHNNVEERTEIEIDSWMNPVDAVANHSVDLGAKLWSIGTVSLNNVALTDGDIIQSGYRTDGADDAVKNDVECQSLNQELELQSAGGDASVNLESPMVGVSSGVAVDASTTNELDEVRLELRSQDGQFLDQMEGNDSSVPKTGTIMDCSVHVDCTNAFAAMSTEGGTLPTDQVFMVGRTNESELANNNVVFGSDRQYDDGRTAGHHNGDLKLDYSLEGDVDVRNAILAEMENQECQEADPWIVVDPTTIASSHGMSEVHGQQDFEAERAEHDTDFLNFDDYDIAEEDDNSMPNAEGGHILDNSGWSARTRAVAKYLQVLFHEEAQHGRKALLLANLLAGKSRKEASRMFFETLVLKTRDYVHAEQEEPFGNISVKPRVKLMKSEF